jgi:hypothetical protein
MLGTRQWIAAQASDLGSSLALGLLGFLTIFGLRRLLRNDFLAALVAAVLFTLQQGEVTRSEEGLIIGGIFLMIYASLAFLLLRIGLVATIVAIFFADGVNMIAMGGDWKGWYIAPSLATFAFFTAIAAFAFWRSLGGRELIGEE